MRKPVTLLLVFILVLLTAMPGFAADYRQAAAEYLAKKHGVPVDHIQVYDGDKIILEYLQESFWCAKYEISAEGSSQAVPPQPPDTIEPAPPQVMLLPEPILQEDTPAFEHGADPDSPVSSSPSYDTGDLSALSNTGVVYIREKTGEILDDAGMETYFLRERELAATAWKKLRQGAGKVEVNFYQRLRESDAQTKFSVRILPTFTEAPELTQRFRELQASYPEYSKGISSLSELFGTTGYASTRLEAVPDIAVPPPSHEAAIDTPLIQGEAEGAGSMPSNGNSAVEPVRDLPVAEEDYEAYHKELEVIRLAGLEASAGIITDKLSDMGINYTYDYGVIATELTKAQVNDFATLDAVQLVCDDQFYAMESGRSLTNTVADTADLDSAAPPVTPIGEKNTPSPYFLLLALLLFCGVYWLHRRHSTS